MGTVLVLGSRGAGRRSPGSELHGAGAWGLALGLALGGRIVSEPEGERALGDASGGTEGSPLVAPVSVTRRIVESRRDCSGRLGAQGTQSQSFDEECELVSSGTPDESISLTPQMASPYSAAEPEGVKTCCFGGKLTPNSKVLLVAMFFFSAITIAQAFAAIAAHSRSLLVDCVSMGIDAASYGFNVISEAWPNPDKRKAERNQLVTAGISFALLIGFTLSFMLEALDTVMQDDDTDDSCCDAGGSDDVCLVANSSCGNYTADEDQCTQSLSADSNNFCVWKGVNPYIVLFFALFGLLFDLISLLAFRKWGQSFSVLVGGEDTEALNMSSALMHVLSDCLRSATTLIESLLILAGTDIPSYVLDGYATLIVTASILGGALRAVYKWVRQLEAWIKAGKEGGSMLAAQGPPPSDGNVQTDNYTPPVVDTA